MNFILMLMVLAGAAVQAGAQGPVFDEYQLKAAYLYNFAKFVEWPPGTFAKSNDSISICIIGQNPFGSELEDMVRGNKIGERAVAVRMLPDTQQAGKCHIVFIGATESKRTSALLESLKGGGILTVGDTEDFTALGGIIRFRLDGTHLHIQIALETAERSKIRISSRLLSLAEIVTRRP